MLVYFLQFSFEESHLSYSQHTMLDNLYEFIVYVSIEYFMRLLNWILPTIMSEYVFVSVQSVIFVYPRFLADIQYDMNMK